MEHINRIGYVGNVSSVLRGFIGKYALYLCTNHDSGFVWVAFVNINNDDIDDSTDDLSILDKCESFVN
jgi:hypothetical protein